MARPLRLEFEGALYHLTGRGNRRERIFEDEKDCARFLGLVEDSLGRFRVLLRAFVLMGNHYLSTKFGTLDALVSHQLHGLL